MRVLAIDPGNTESAYAYVDAEWLAPIQVGKIPNDELMCVMDGSYADRCAIEMVASYGMPVGADVFETCVWAGRFFQQWEQGRAWMLDRHDDAPQLVYRRDVKLHHCGSVRAKDANVTQALIDRFAPNTPNKGKGTKADPGWFYGFKADIWQAYALAVYVADSTRVATNA